MTHTTHSSARVLACVKRYKEYGTAKYQTDLETATEAILVRLNREYESAWKWFGLRKLTPPTREQALEEARFAISLWSSVRLKKVEETADKWTRLLRGTEFVEVSLEDAWIFSY